MSQHVGSWWQPGVEGRAANPCPPNGLLLCDLTYLPDPLGRLLRKRLGPDLRPLQFSCEIIF